MSGDTQGYADLRKGCKGYRPDLPPQVPVETLRLRGARGSVEEAPLLFSEGVNLRGR